MATRFDRGSEPCLAPVPSGWRYRVNTLPPRAWVTPQLAAALQNVFERFAEESGFTSGNPATIELRPGVFGHHQLGRAVDIYGVGGRGIGTWSARWSAALRASAETQDPRARHILRNRQLMTNLGWRLYKAMQIYGRWAQPYGYPVQLFGPWTRSEGPWKHISDRLLFAHRDHIHAAK